MQNAIKLSLLSCALMSQLQAENQYTIETINVTASQGTTLNKKDVTDSVTVITKEELEESRVTTLNEALNKLGGISMTQNGGVGTSSSMFLRGMDSKRLLVLIDGVRYNNPTAIGAAAEFSQIMLSNVEQIEIIKGAQSGIWGSDASGGVINIITSKVKTGLHAVANVEYGSFDTKKTSLQTSYATEKYDISLGGFYLNTDGFSAAEATKSQASYGSRYDVLGLEKDRYINQSLNAKLGYNFTKIDRVEANIQSIDSSVDYDSGAGTANDSTIPNTLLQNRFYSLIYTQKGATHEVLAIYSLSTFDRDVTYVDFFTGNPASSTYKGSVNEAKVDDKISYAKDSFLRVGVSYQQFAQEEITPNTDKDFTAISVFATNYNKLELLESRNTILTESIRYDSYDNFDDALTGKLGVKQFFTKELYLSANVGTGYNAPTLGQLYGAFGANPNLKPETSLTSDITIGTDTIWVTGFYNEITDLIEYTTAYVQVSGTSKFKGIELGYEDYFFDSLGINAMYTYLETEDADGKELARRPKDQVDVKATYYVDENFDISLNAQYIGERYNGPEWGATDDGAQTGKYTIVGLVSNVKVNKTVTVYGKIDNLTDKYYQTVDGYATAGRSLYLGLIANY
ncbi:MAG: TonB-dependent receptor [Sulfurimonas sp.]|nr:TonB-dependent receptor [Sulfurimonas sp.]